MSDFKSIPGGICAPKGFSAAGVHCGIRHNHSKLDLALIKADVRCAGAGCYTTNKVYGAPITVDREHLKDGYAQAIVVNSGNANTCAPNGVQLAKDTCDIVAKELSIRADDVLPSSTGVIGQAMSIEPFAKGIPEAAAKLAADEAGSHDAATAIMTTDTFPRWPDRRCRRRQGRAHRRYRQGQRHDPPEHGHDAALYDHRRQGRARRAAKGAVHRRARHLQPDFG